MVMAKDITEDVLLLAAAAVEQGSAHPLAQAVLRRASKLKVAAPTGFKSIDGQGAPAQTAAGTVFLGNRLLMDTQKLALGPLEADADQLQGEGRTVVAINALLLKRTKLAGIKSVKPKATTTATLAAAGATT